MKQSNNNPQNNSKIKPSDSYAKIRAMESKLDAIIKKCGDIFNPTMMDDIAEGEQLKKDLSDAKFKSELSYNPKSIYGYDFADVVESKLRELGFWTRQTMGCSQLRVFSSATQKELDAIVDECWNECGLDEDDGEWVLDTVQSTTYNADGTVHSTETKQGQIIIK